MLQSPSSLHLTWWRALPRRNTPLSITTLLTPLTETQNGCLAWDKVLLAFNLPSWAGRREAVINSHCLAACWGPSCALKRCSQSWDTVVIVTLVPRKKKRKKKGAFCFLHVLHFLPAASWAEDDFAPWATKETKTCPEVAEQSTALDMHWACVKELSSASLLQQPSTGGGKLIGGVGGSGEAFKASKRGPKRGWAGQYLPELC